MGRTKDEISSASASATREKKPYEAPALIEWGTLRDLTLAIGPSGNPDGAKKGAKTTH